MLRDVALRPVVEDELRGGFTQRGDVARGSVEPARLRARVVNRLWLT
ncbi:hypothetical protein [Amycolatopsis sp. cmx-8-4]